MCYILTTFLALPWHHDPDIVASEKGTLHGQVRGAAPVVTRGVVVVVPERLTVGVPVALSATFSGGSFSAGELKNKICRSK